MDLLDHLVKEHRQVESLIDQLADTDPGSRRSELLDELAHELRVHMEVEEQFLYPLVEEVLGDDDETQEGTNEHDLARDGMSKLYELRDEPGFAAALDMLKAGLTHHHQDEEEDMFPDLRDKAPDRVELDAEALESFVDLTKEQLYRKAKSAEVDGRSDMSRDELGRALADRR